MNPKELSRGEEEFLFHCRAYKFTEPKREYQFCDGNKFRFDFAWPEWKVAVEIEGGVWRNGRHNRGNGFEADCKKYNLAALGGWKVFRFTTGQVKSGEAIEFIRTVIS